MISNSIFCGSGFDFSLFLKRVEGLSAFELLKVLDEQKEKCYYFLGTDSVSPFLIREWDDAELELSISPWAAYADYELYPKLLKELIAFVGLKGEQEIWDESEICFEDGWIEESIGEEVAMLKCSLSVAPRYYISLAKEDFLYVSEAILRDYGVGISSSTPRIYGYVQYLLRNNLLQRATRDELMEDIALSQVDMEVDVPQHQSIGRVKSWQIDGAETWETYSREDVEMLLEIASKYVEGNVFAGEVLNDIGTLYQEGIGVDVDGKKAEFWFSEAIKRGELIFAPNNLGDLYRKGSVGLPISLSDAFRAYAVSEDPYGHYRVGQAYEEGWAAEPDISKAMEWYRRSAAEGHHLAIKKLAK